MAVRARFMMENPDKIEATMKITMTLEEWTRIRDELPNTWPHWRLSSCITELITQARKVFYEEQKTQE